MFSRGSVGARPLEAPLNAYVQGGVPDNDPPEYPMTLTVRTLSPKEKAERITALRESLDERKRQYGETMEVSPSAP